MKYKNDELITFRCPRMMKLMIIDQCKKYDLKMSYVIRIICNEYFHKITNDKNVH
jgi:hypothetical protein